MKKNFSKNEFRFFKTLLGIDQKGLLLWLTSHLETLYNSERVVASNEYVYAIGDIPVMLVAHMDTVHTYEPVDVYYDRDQNVMWSPQGIGADDRAGIYGVLAQLWKGHRPHVLFTTDEEIGGLGAQAAAKELEPELNFVIQLDRRGIDDAVYYDCDNPDFEKYINKFGFKTAIGSFSDISYLCPAWKVAGVNLSIGYKDEHTKYETLHVTNMFSTIDKVDKILKTIDVEKDKFIYIEDVEVARYKGYGRRALDFGYSGTDLLDKSSSAIYGNRGTAGDYEICYNCFEGFSGDMIIQVPGYGKYCGDCFSKVFTTCTTCKELFIDKTKTHLQCEECRGEV